MSEYTQEQVDEIVGTYKTVADQDYATRQEIVDELAAKFEKSVPSVRGVLVSQKVYVPKEKTATPEASSGTSKEEIVKAMEAVSGLKLASFNKATKKDLQAFWDYLVAASDAREVS